MIAIKKGPLQGPKTKNISESSIPKHYGIIHPKRYTTQPQTSEMGRLTNFLKRNGIVKRHSLMDFLEALSRGHNAIISNVEIEEVEGEPLGRIRFVSSSLIMIDIDDDEKVTDPEKVFQQLPEAAALFYTWSHSKERNRYRIVYQLDRAISDEFIYKLLTESLLDELTEKGFPVDRNVKNPKGIVRGGNSGYLLNDTDARLNTTERIQRVRQEHERRADARKKAYTHAVDNKFSFPELLEMANSIGYIPSGSGDMEKWSRIVYGIKNYVDIGAITEIEGFELFSIISGNEKDEKTFQHMTATNATIGSLVYYAEQAGYKRKPGSRYLYGMRLESASRVPTEKHQIKKGEYVPESLALDLLERKQRILFEAPTGSGKTTQFIKAFKVLASAKKRFFVLSVPTIALAEQVARTHGIFLVKGQEKELFSRIHKGIHSGNRIFVSTYDMTAILTDLLLESDRLARLTLVADEWHRVVTDYSPDFRKNAIQGLQDSSLKASAFVALSGTPQDVLKDGFDMVVSADNGQPSPCSDFSVYTYEKAAESIPMLVHLIESKVSAKKRLLIYIQNKKTITRVYDVLRKKGIKARTITAKTKRSPLYKDLVERETVADDVDIILTTSVIADGINIKNDFRWECIVFLDQGSRLYNVATIKQISNRFRNEYGRFAMFMLEPRNKEEDRFHIESAYRYMKRLSSRFVSLLESEFSVKDIALFRGSIIEKKYGIEATEKGFSVDDFYLRHYVSGEQENYYSGRRIAFIRAIETIIGKKLHGTLNVSEAVRKGTLDLQGTEQHLKDLETEDKQAEVVKRDGISQAFTRTVYNSFIAGNDDMIREFKQTVTPSHFACIAGLHQFTDFDTCRHIVGNIKRDADTHAYMNAVSGLVDQWHFHSFDRKTPTREIYFAILDEIGTHFILSADLKHAMKKIAKKQRASIKDVQSVMNRMFHKTVTKKTGGTRYAKLNPWTVENIGNVFGLENIQVIESIRKYAETTSKPTQISVENILNN